MLSVSSMCNVPNQQIGFRGKGNLDKKSLELSQKLAQNIQSTTEPTAGERITKALKAYNLKCPYSGKIIPPGETTHERIVIPKSFIRKALKTEDKENAEKVFSKQWKNTHQNTLMLQSSFKNILQNVEKC